MINNTNDSDVDVLRLTQRIDARNLLRSSSHVCWHWQNSSSTSLLAYLLQSIADGRCIHFCPCDSHFFNADLL